MGRCISLAISSLQHQKVCCPGVGSVMINLFNSASVINQPQVSTPGRLKIKFYCFGNSLAPGFGAEKAALAPNAILHLGHGIGGSGQKVCEPFRKHGQIVQVIADGEHVAGIEA